jgi:hypothetical protein
MLLSSHCNTLLALSFNFYAVFNILLSANWKYINRPVLIELSQWGKVYSLYRASPTTYAKYPSRLFMQSSCKDSSAFRPFCIVSRMYWSVQVRWFHPENFNIFKGAHAHVSVNLNCSRRKFLQLSSADFLSVFNVRLFSWSNLGWQKRKHGLILILIINIIWSTPLPMWTKKLKTTF